MNRDTTLPFDDFAHLLADDDEPTRVWERAVFFGEPVRPHAADRPLPDVSRVLRVAEPTRPERIDPRPHARGPAPSRLAPPVGREGLSSERLR